MFHCLRVLLLCIWSSHTNKVWQTLTFPSMHLPEHNSTCETAGFKTVWLHLPVKSNQHTSQSCLQSLIIVSMECDVATIRGVTLAISVCFHLGFIDFPRPNHNYMIQQRPQVQMQWVVWYWICVGLYHNGPTVGSSNLILKYWDMSDRNSTHEKISQIQNILVNLLHWWFRDNF